MKNKSFIIFIKHL